jgi:tetratricopeptide (TPR) repeat protein
LNPDSLASIRASESTSPDAARLYAEGLMRLRRFDAVKARELLERAIQMDPKFVLPYSALADTWSALGYDGQARQAAQRAFELSASLPRSERLQVEGHISRDVEIVERGDCGLANVGEFLP